MCIRDRNKRALQRELGLEENDKKFMIGIVSRLTDQKGLDLVDYVIEEICAEDTQLVVLGTGEEKYEHLFRHFEWKYHDRVSANIYYSNERSHKMCIRDRACIGAQFYSKKGYKTNISKQNCNMEIIKYKYCDSKFFRKG